MWLCTLLGWVSGLPSRPFCFALAHRYSVGPVKREMSCSSSNQSRQHRAQLLRGKGLLAFPVLRNKFQVICLCKSLWALMALSVIVNVKLWRREFVRELFSNYWGNLLVRFGRGMDTQENCWSVLLLLWHFRAKEVESITVLSDVITYLLFILDRWI